MVFKFCTIFPKIYFIWIINKSNCKNVRIDNILDGYIQFRVLKMLLESMSFCYRRGPLDEEEDVLAKIPGVKSQACAS